MNLFAVLLTLLTSISAYSSEFAVLDAYGIINLRTDANVLDFHANYPGHGGKPDCLVFVTEASRYEQRGNLAGLKDLVKELEVYSGDGILFNQPDFKLINFDNKNTQGYIIPEVWRYVTGIRVTAKTGTLDSLIQQYLPDYDGIIGLQRVPNNSKGRYGTCRT